MFSNIKAVGEYTEPVKACDNLICNSQIKDVFFETYNELNLNLNYESSKKIKIN